MGERRYEIHQPRPEGSCVIGHADTFEEANRAMNHIPNAEAYDTVERCWVVPEPETTAELYAEIGGYHLSSGDWFLSVYDWERLPGELKDRVVDAFFNTGKGWESEEYREAVRAAVGWVKANPR